MKYLKGRINYYIISLLIIVGILIIINVRYSFNLNKLDERTAEQNGVFILSLIRFNDIVESYIEKNDYSEKELYGLGQRCISASIESNNLGMQTLSIDYRYLGERLENLSSIYKTGREEEKAEIIKEIKHFINTSKGIYKIIKDNSKGLYSISIEELRSTELMGKINTYHLKKQEEFYGNLD